MGCLTLQHFTANKAAVVVVLYPCLWVRVPGESRQLSVAGYLEVSRKAMPRGRSQEEVRGWSTECKQPSDRDVTDCPILSSGTLLQAMLILASW